MARIIELIKESFQGEERDYTAIGVRRAIVLLSIPMVLEMGMEALFALVDAFFVSKLGVNASATVGFTESMLTIVYSVAWGLGMGATAVVARRTGEKDGAGVRAAAGQGVLVALLAGLAFALPGMVFGRELLQLMGAAPGVVAEGEWYTRIMLGSNVVIMLLFAINAIFRGAGAAYMALWSLALANVINIVLDPLLIFGIGPFPELGVTGAAVSTTIGRGCGVLFQLYHLTRRGGPFEMGLAQLRPAWNVMANIVKVSLGGIGQFVIASASWVFLVRIVSESGTDATAGYFVAVRIIIFTLLPGWGLANAAATLVGQNLGASKPDRAARSTWLCGHYNAAFMASVALLFWLTAPWLISFFAQTPAADAYAIEALRIISLGYLFYGYGMVFAQAFNGAGDSLTPTWMNVVCFWLIEIPLAWFFAKILGWGPAGVFASIAVSESALAVLSAVLFQRGSWKRVNV